MWIPKREFAGILGVAGARPGNRPDSADAVRRAAPPFAARLARIVTTHVDLAPGTRLGVSRQRAITSQENGRNSSGWVRMYPTTR